ncbi:MAG: hypothetical protein FWD17_07305 [Polyangiaceae bacterium]|nr:hypothetical protein [Polyangiaceae bacterium]
MRDQSASVFAGILGTLVQRIPGARAAALVDAEGETVDFAGELDPFDVKVAAAHWRLVFNQARAQPALRCAQWISGRASASSFIVRGLPDEYAVVVVLTRAAGLLGALRRAFADCASALGREAGWPPEHAAAHWFAIDVVSERNRPTAIRRGASAEPLEVIGILAAGLGRREQGWRIRTASGVEATLIREPGGLWYAADIAGVTPRDLEWLRHGAPSPKKKL